MGQDKVIKLAKYSLLSPTN